MNTNPRGPFSSDPSALNTGSSPEAGTFCPPFPSATADGPRIFSHTADAGPDESFVLVGDNLNSGLRLWGRSDRCPQGELYRPKVHVCTDSYLLATVPQRCYDGLFAVWIESETGTSRTIFLNQPDCWWAMPECVKPGEELRIFGRNLSRRPDEGRPRVYLDRADTNAPVEAELESWDHHQIRLRIPNNIPTGSFSVRVHAGYGGRFGWSNALALTIAKTPGGRRAEFDVNTTDEAALRDAIRRAERAGGGIVRLPDGIVQLHGTIEVGPGVTVKGRGRRNTLLRFMPADDTGYEVRTEAGDWAGPIGMSTGANKIEFDIEVPRDGEWIVHARYATEMSFRGHSGASGRTTLSVDNGKPVPLENMPNTGDFDAFQWTRCATLELPAGRHRLMWRSRGGRFVKLDALALTQDPDFEPPEGAMPCPSGDVLMLRSEDVSRFYADDKFEPPAHRTAIWMRGDNARLCDVSMEGCQTTEAGILVQHREFPRWIDGCTVENVSVREIEGKRWRNRPIHLRYARGARVQKCELWGQAPVYLSGIAQTVIAGNRLVCQTRYGSNANGAILGRQNIVRECVIENNTVTAPPGRRAGTPKVRRMIWLSTGHGSVAHNYIAGNRTERTRYGGLSGTDQNVGETILFESCQRVAYFGPCEEAGTRSVTLPRKRPPTPQERMGWALEADLNRDADGHERPFRPSDATADAGIGEPPTTEYYVTVIDGPATGQTRRIARWQEHRLLLERNWDVPPAPTSTILVSTLYHQNLILQNHPRGGMSGVQLWLGCVENIISENDISCQEGSGISVTAACTTLGTSMRMTWNRGIGPVNFNVFEGNRSDECRSGFTLGATPSTDKLPVDFPLALGNVVRHNSFTGCRRDGLSLTGQRAEADGVGLCRGTVVEFNFVRDGRSGFRTNRGVEGCLIRRNTTSFWNPVPGDERSVGYDAAAGSHCVLTANVVEGRCPGTGQRPVHAKKGTDPVAETED